MGDDQFDFDGASKGADGGEAGFGAGWEDDLETMLLKGMKKKAQRRIAMMASMGVLGMLVGAGGMYIGRTATRNTQAAPETTADACAGNTPWTQCRGCSALHGRHYEGWSVACSNIQNVDCDGCYGGEVPDTQTDVNRQKIQCPHGCNCFVTCDHEQGWESNALIVGDDEAYIISCQDGSWEGEDCRPGSSSCRGAHGEVLAAKQDTLCIDHDDCASQPCQNGGDCSDALQNYTCACHPGFSGADCSIDVDECSFGYTDLETQLYYPANPCSLVRHNAIMRRLHLALPVSGTQRTDHACLCRVKECQARRGALSLVEYIPTKGRR